MALSELNVAGGEDAVLLIHGLTGSPFELKFLTRQLHKAGFTVRVPCLAGHGTTVADLQRTHWQDWYGSVREAFDDLRRTHRSVSVSGLCMGAVLALYLAAEAGDSVSGLSLMSTTLFYDGWSLPWYRFLLPLAYYTPLRYFTYYQEREPYGIKNEKRRSLALKAMNHAGIAYTRYPSTSMYELFKLVGATKKIMHRVTAPSLILHSLEDDVASVENAHYVARHVGSATVRKVLLDDCYHMITMDNQRERAAEEMVNFLKEHAVHPTPATCGV